MKRTVPLAALAALNIVAFAASRDALAVGNIARVTIVDRSTGTELTAHYYRGEYWVAGTPGNNYAIAIHNNLGERLLAVTSVDGVNVVSGNTAAWNQTGYVFYPGQTYQIAGWRKSDTEIAAFTFTDVASSYAARTGRPANVGVIGVALFRERQPEPPTTTNAPPVTGAPFAESTAPAPTPEPGRRSDSAAAKSSVNAAGRLEQELGTGHGERQYSYVDRTDFERLQAEPNEVIRIRYDSLNNLIAMGIVRPPRTMSPHVEPFPASPQQQYVPDPPG